MLDAFGHRALAGPTAAAKRLVCITVAHGVFAQNWLPFVSKGMPIGTVSPGSMLKAPSAFLKQVDFEQRTGCTAIDLAPYTTALSPIHSAKWQSFKKQTAFLNNLSCSNATVQGHTSTAPLGGYKNGCQACAEPTSVTYTGETVDVVVGRKLNGRLPLVLKCPDTVNDALVAYQEARARGGVGLIVLQVSGVHETARYTHHVLMATCDASIPGYRRVAEAVHRYDTVLFA